MRWRRSPKPIRDAYVGEATTSGYVYKPFVIEVANCTCGLSREHTLFEHDQKMLARQGIVQSTLERGLAEVTSRMSDCRRMYAEYMQVVQTGVASEIDAARKRHEKAVDDEREAIDRMAENIKEVWG